jgi:hemoglobin
MRSVILSMVVLATMAFVGCENWNKDNGGDMKSADAMATKSLYDRLGGKPAITAVVDDFVGRAASDPKVNFTRKGIPGAEWQATPENVAHLKMSLVDFISQATGGPKAYKGKDMKSAHANMQITEAEFGAIAADLKASLDKLNVQAKEQSELMAIVGTTHDAIVTKH